MAPDREGPTDDAVDIDSRQSVLYPVFDSHDSRTCEIARDIAEGVGMTLFVLDLVETSDEIIDESRSVFRELLDEHLDDDHDVSVETRFEQTDDPVGETVSVAQSHDTALIVFDDHSPESLVGGDITNRISDEVPCDIVTVERTRGSRLASILVPVAGGPHSQLSVAVAGAIARSARAVVDLFHVVTSEETDDQSDALFETAREQLPADVEVDTWRLERPDVSDAIVEQSDRYDLIVLGEPDRGRLRRYLSGSVTDSVSTDASNTVLVSRRSNVSSFGL
jgi:nucleotide-binding universal stress UspA family protein